MSKRIFNSIALALLLSLSSLHLAAAPAAALPDQAAEKGPPPKPDDSESEDDAPSQVSAAAAVSPVKPIEPVAPTSPAAESVKTPAAANAGHTECKHLTVDSNAWKVGVCGYVALNAMHDSTQGLGAGLNNSMIARPGTYAGDHDQMQFTARDSRINVEAAAPTTHASAKRLRLLQQIGK